MNGTSESQTEELLTRGVAEVIDRQHLLLRLRRGEKLRLKLGIDPTGAKLHLGHAVPLRIMRRFQDCGHTVVLIIGDTTATIGDPSGRNETRPPLTKQEITKNIATYERQALKILDRKRLEFRWQSEWHKKFSISEVIGEAAKLSAGWILSHETFRQRMKSGQPLALHELLYPLLQAYDSVAVKADVEFGGLDQKFNLLTGRELMKAHGLEPQDVVLAKYLIGTDGQKMGKSLNNFIALEEEPFEMFGKIMSMPDTVLRDYFEFATDVPMEEIEKMKFTDVAARDAKLRLAETIVGSYHGKEEAKLARISWNQFTEKGISAESKLFYIDKRKKTLKKNDEFMLRDVIVRVGLAKSKSESQRLFEQGAVQLDGRVTKDWRTKVKELPPVDHNLIVGKKNTRVLITRLG